MNPYEQFTKLLALSPVPPCIQQLIYYNLVGYGTPSTSAIHSRIFGHLKRYISTYYGQMALHYYNATHFSRIALLELHLIYLINNPHVVSSVRCMSNSLNVIKKNRLVRLMEEELDK
jgi:hypothetical protein